MNKFSKIANGVILAMSLLEIAYADTNRWTGFYAGANTGIIFNDAQLRSQHLGFTNPSDTCNTCENFSTFTAGMQFGYLYQFSNQIVSGVEASIGFNANQQRALSCTSHFNANVYDRFSFKNQMQGSLKGRAGRALNWNNNIFLPYLTAGASLIDAGLTYQNEGSDYYSQHNTHTGWLIGAGVEWAFMQNWSLRAEYYYLDDGSVVSLNIPTVYGLFDPNGHAHVNLSSNNIVVAVNYWV